MKKHLLLLICIFGLQTQYTAGIENKSTARWLISIPVDTVTTTWQAIKKIPELLKRSENISSNVKDTTKAIKDISPDLREIVKDARVITENIKQISQGLYMYATHATISACGLGLIGWGAHQLHNQREQKANHPHDEYTTQEKKQYYKNVACIAAGISLLCLSKMIAKKVASF